MKYSYLKLNERKLTNIIRKVMLESELLLERPGCGNDDECGSTEVCSKKARDGDGACVPICRRGSKGRGCKPLSVIPNDNNMKDLDTQDLNEAQKPCDGEYDTSSSCTDCCDGAKDWEYEFGEGTAGSGCGDGNGPGGCYSSIRVKDDRMDYDRSRGTGRDYEDYPPSDTGKKKYYCVMKGRPCWELEERDPSAKGNKGYRSERKCNRNC